MNVILIDDEPLARQLLKNYLQDYPQFNIVDECGDGFEANKSIHKHSPDLVFLDIQMPRLSGLELLELIENPPAVIFTTAFDEFAIKAFDANAIDYLLKPFSKDRFNKAIQKFLSNRTSGKSIQEKITQSELNPIESDRIVVKNGTDIRILSLEEIHYFEAMDDYVKIYTSKGMFMKKQTLAHFEKILEAKHFTRIHRSYLLNNRELYRIEPFTKDQFQAVLRNGTKISLSKQGYSRLRDKLGI